MRFYLGTVDPGWLQEPAFETVPLFVSRNRLVGYTAELRARTRWALDSGAFTEISRHGRWTVPAAQYAREAKRWQTQIGRMDWASIQDYMVEPEMLKKTGKSVVEHQQLTTRSYLELMMIDPSIPWIPVLQGWEHDSYLHHVDAYAKAGVDLTREPVVGVGSVCRRQATDEAERLMRSLYRLNILPHGYGFKKDGVVRAGKYMELSDSMAWSYAARFRPVRLRDCTHPYPTCEYCERWALQWRRQLLRALADSL